MTKTVMAKFSRLPNVVGRVDYISNPKRQENLLGFYQTPEDPGFFWRALAEESQEQDKYNRGQMEKHNEEQQRLWEAGEIKSRHFLKTIEARENMLCLPNDLLDKIPPQEVAKFLAEDIKRRHGIECAVGVHLNKTKTNYHAHIILPERRLLEQSKVSIATRNTYFDENGKRSSKAACTENGELKPGCRLVNKGEALSTRRFSEKDEKIASKLFCYEEKCYYAKLFNELSKDRWVVYNHFRSPHLRLMDIKKGEPEGLTAWKNYCNAQNKAYSNVINEMLTNAEITYDQAMAIKSRIYQERKENKQKLLEERERWIREGGKVAHQNNYADYVREDGTRKGLFDVLVRLALTVAGYDQEDEVLNSSEAAAPIRTYQNKRLQNMVDDLARAAGRKSATELLAEKKARKIAEQVRMPSLLEQIQSAEKRKQDENRERAPGKLPER